jgi:hypothetical protein
MASSLATTTTPVGAATTAAPVPGSDAVLFATLFLQGINAPLTANNYANFFRWANHESGSGGLHGNWNNYNPLNIVRTSGDGSTGGTGDVNHDIADFPDVATGAAATVRFFKAADGGAPSSTPLLTAFQKDAQTSVVQSGVDAFYTWDPTFSLEGISANPPATIGKGFSSATSGSTDVVLTSAGGLSGVGDWIKNKLGGLPVGGILDPGLTLGSVFGAVGDTAGFFKALGGLFSNWHYVAYVLGGIAAVVLGIILIMHDTGADARLARGGTKAVEIGALA